MQVARVLVQSEEDGDRAGSPSTPAYAEMFTRESDGGCVRKFQDIAVRLPRATEQELVIHFLTGLTTAVRVQVELHGPDILARAIRFASRVGEIHETVSGERRAPVMAMERGGAGGISSQGEIPFPLSFLAMGSFLSRMKRALRNDFVRGRLRTTLSAIEGRKPMEGAGRQGRGFGRRGVCGQRPGCVGTVEEEEVMVRNSPEQRSRGAAL
ncbi:hypothetical protein BSKO_14102 [Bryopsis sp. KO-2023]|nr:hypothetical protein BSKO_14102 [Bryopsis sp. KO-2023]